MKIDTKNTKYILESMKKITLKNVVWKEGKHYVVQCLNVDISSFGKSKKEALLNLEEALDLYFEDAKNPNILKISQPEVVNSNFKYA